MSLCLAPGKIMLAGEYAVIDGSEAIMLAVNRYALASVQASPQHLSPFLRAVHKVISDSYGEDSPQAQAALRVRVDTDAFREGRLKLGLGSSAAATVAAVGAALGDRFSSDTVHTLARQAHGDAQEPKGTRGSGADVASCTYGGCLRFSVTEGSSVLAELSLPESLHLVFPWCGQSASTTALVPQVRQLRSADPRHYATLTAAIAASAQELAAALDPAGAIAAIAAGGRAAQDLGEAAGTPIWLPIHSQMREVAAELGGALKPTGAGGGDLALGAFASQESAQRFVQRLNDHGIQCPSLAPSHQGVRLQSQPSMVGE